MQIKPDQTTVWRLTLQSALLLLAVAILLDVIGFCSITPHSNFSSNSAFYIEMAQNGANTVRPPFRYRALVPFVARHLPVPADQALVLITHVSLVGCLFLAMLICKRVGLSNSSCIFGAVAIFCSRAFIYNYVNPYMTDALALLAIFAMSYAYIEEREAAFGVAAVVGVLAHEIAVFLVPAIVFSRRWKGGLAVCLAPVAVLVFTRFWLGAGYAGSLKKEFLFVSVHIYHPVDWLKAVVLTWYLLWPLATMGIAMLPRKRFPLLVCSVLLTGGALFLSSFVLDTERTYSILDPVIAVGAATVFDVLWKRGRTKALGLLTFPLAGIASAEAYMTGSRDLKVLAVCSVPALVYGVYILKTCFSEMREGWRMHGAAAQQFFSDLTAGGNPR